MKLGTATSVLIRYSMEDAIDLIAQVGFDGIDVWGGRPHLYRRDYNAERLRALRTRIEDHGMVVSSFMPAFYRYPHSLSSPNEIVRKDSVHYMIESMENAVALGSPILLVVPDHSLFGEKSEDSFSRMLDCVDEIARRAQQYEIKLGLEVLHDDETDLVNTSSDAMRIIEELGYDNLGVVVDTGALNLSGESIQDVIATTGDRLLQVHVNDNDGIEQQNLVPGDGTFDFEGMIEDLRAGGFDGFLSAELTKGFGADPAPPLEKTVERMRAWMDRAG